jgi:hypothetical protein
MTCTHILRCFSDGAEAGSVQFVAPGQSGTQGYDSKSIIVIDWITVALNMGTTPGASIVAITDLDDAGGRTTWECNLQVPASEMDTAHFVFPGGLPMKGANNATLVGTGVVGLGSSALSIDLTAVAGSVIHAFVGYHYAPASSVR